MDRKTLAARFYVLRRDNPDCWSHVMMYVHGALPELAVADRERLYALGLADRDGRIPPAIRAYLTMPTPS